MESIDAFQFDEPELPHVYRNEDENNVYWTPMRCSSILVSSEEATRGDVDEYRNRVDQGLPIFDDGEPVTVRRYRRRKESKSINRNARQVELSKRVLAYIDEHGESKMVDVAEALGVTKEMVSRAVTANSELERFQRWSRDARWQSVRRAKQ